MSSRSILAAAAIAAAFSAPAIVPASAADMAAPLAACAPPTSYTAAPVLGTFKEWRLFNVNRPPRIQDVARYDPRNPPPAAVPAPSNLPGPGYVAPQTAYLASSLCDFAYGQARRSWYDGKLFYLPGGIGGGPDSFMVIERD